MNHVQQQQTANMLVRLNEAERLFIWGFRAMAQRRELGWPTTADIRQVYEHFRVEDAVPSVDALLEAFFCTAHTTIELHRPGCLHVSPSELLLLQALSAAQSERIGPMRQQFECWLPPIAADWVAEPARGLGRVFRAAGLIFPIRDARPLIVDETMRIQSWQVGPPTLH